jgi:hypothetical protein
MILSKLNLKNTILILVMLFSTGLFAIDKCSNGQPPCGSEKMCCAPGYTCKMNKCVFDKNTKTFDFSPSRLPEIKQTKAPRAKNVSAPATVSAPSSNSLYQVRSASQDKSSLYKQMKDADTKIYKNLPKGNYVRCYNGEIEKIEIKSRASLHSCKGKGGVFEYRVNSK